MKSSLARLAVLASLACALAGFGPALGAAPAAADAGTPQTSSVLPSCACETTFTIEKLQEIAGSGSGFTTSPLIGAIGQTVDYEIVLTNTGVAPETFTEFTDLQCDPGTLAGGPGQSAVAPGQSSTFTCNHVLTAVGPYTNEAMVTGIGLLGSPVTQTSNRVVVEVPPPVVGGPPAPAFTIEKRQKIGGTPGAFTAAQLTGAIGQAVEYEIVVNNTGDVPLTFSSLEDAKCDAATVAGGPGGAPLAPGTSTTFTCRHVLLVAGPYTNEATITGTPAGGSPISHTSNQVEVVVPAQAAARPEFSIEKSQKIHGSATGFTTAPLETTMGSVVDYQIVVKNTGTTMLTFTGFVDPQCDAGTIAGAPAEVTVGPGSSATYTCSRVLPTNGKYLNQASITGTAPGEAPVAHTSNQVEVNAAGQGQLPRCEESSPVLRGIAGPKRAPFTAQVSAAGIRQITFYLDGRKLKTLKRSQARGDRFTVRIDPRKLSHRRHRVSIKGTMTDPVCGPFAQASSFVRPFAASRPVFTG
jgi:hypothetical protein